MDFIVQQSNLYGQQQNKTLNITKEELYVVFGVFLLSGHASFQIRDSTGHEKKIPSRLYWSREKIKEIVKDAIRCNRFEDTIRHIHFNEMTVNK